MAKKNIKEELAEIKSFADLAEKIGLGKDFALSAHLVGMARSVWEGTPGIKKIVVWCLIFSCILAVPSIVLGVIALWKVGKMQVILAFFVSVVLEASYNFVFPFGIAFPAAFLAFVRNASFRAQVIAVTILVMSTAGEIVSVNYNSNHSSVGIEWWNNLERRILDKRKPLLISMANELQGEYNDVKVITPEIEREVKKKRDAFNIKKNWLLSPEDPTNSILKAEDEIAKGLLDDMGFFAEKIGHSLLIGYICSFFGFFISCMSYFAWAWPVMLQLDAFWEHQKRQEYHGYASYGGNSGDSKDSTDEQRNSGDKTLDSLPQSRQSDGQYTDNNQSAQSVPARRHSKSSNKFGWLMRFLKFGSSSNKSGSNNAKNSNLNQQPPVTISEPREPIAHNSKSDDGQKSNRPQNTPDNTAKIHEQNIETDTHNNNGGSRIVQAPEKTESVSKSNSREPVINYKFDDRHRDDRAAIELIQ